LAVKWWFKGARPSKPRFNRKKRAIVDAVSCLEESNKEYRSNKFKLFSKGEASRARKNGRIKARGKSKALREFIKENKGKNDKKFVIEVSSSKFKQSYDLTDYKAPSYKASQNELDGLNKLWKKFDKNMVGFVSRDDVNKILSEIGIKDSFPGAGQVTFDDFAAWWFQAEYTRPERKKDQEKKTEQKKYDFSDKRKSFREFRSKNSKKGRKSHWDLNFFIGKDKTFKNNVEFYEQVFAPAGSETQLQQLDKIWKAADKEGFGRFGETQFISFLKKQGLHVTDKSIVDRMKNAEGFVTYEKFATWWFSKPTKGVQNKEVTPSPKKKQMVAAIRSQTKGSAAKLKSRFNLVTDEESAKARQAARAKFDVVRKDFADWRAKSCSSSPKKKSRDQYDFDFEISYKDPNDGGLTVVGSAAIIG